MAKHNDAITLQETASATDLALRQIRKWIETGVYPCGSQLPSERMLCKKIGLSRRAVRASLRRLEAEGLIRGGCRRRRVVLGNRPDTGGVLSNAVLIAAEQPVVSHHAFDLRESGWSSAIHAGVTAEVLGGGHQAMTVPVRDGHRVRRWLDMREVPVGVILLSKPSTASDWGTLLKSLEAPVVAYGDLVQGFPADRVVSDHEEGQYRLTRWMFAHGRQRILLCAGSRVNALPWTEARLRGYARACAEAGVEPRPLVEVPGRGSPPDNESVFREDAHLYAGYLARHLLGDTPVDAILALSDGFVPDIAAACRILGRPPEEGIWIAGYDNYWREDPRRAWEPYTPVATVDKQNWEIGRSLARLLRERLTGRGDVPPVTCRVTPRLVVQADKKEKCA